MEALALEERCRGLLERGHVALAIFELEEVERAFLVEAEPNSDGVIEDGLSATVRLICRDLEAAADLPEQEIVAVLTRSEVHELDVHDDVLIEGALRDVNAGDWLAILLDRDRTTVGTDDLSCGRRVIDFKNVLTGASGAAIVNRKSRHISHPNSSAARK